MGGKRNRPGSRVSEPRNWSSVHTLDRSNIRFAITFGVNLIGPVYGALFSRQLSCSSQPSGKVGSGGTNPKKASPTAWTGAATTSLPALARTVFSASVKSAPLTTKSPEPSMKVVRRSRVPPISTSGEVTT